MNAAGRTLTKGELLEAFAGLGDNDPIVLLDGMPLLRADATGEITAETDFWSDSDAEQEMRELLECIANDKLTKAQILDLVKGYAT